MILAGLATGTMTSSSTFFTLLGLEQKILKVPGWAISPMAMLAEPVPLAVPSAAARQHGFHHLLRAGELERLHVQAGFLEVAQLDRRVERQAGRDRPVADADLRAGLGAHEGRRAQHAQRRAGGAGLQQLAARGGGGGWEVGDGVHGVLLDERVEEGMEVEGVRRPAP